MIKADLYHSAGPMNFVFTFSAAHKKDVGYTKIPWYFHWSTCGKNPKGSQALETDTLLSDKAENALV